MIRSVDERCRHVATFRRASVWLMETAARWTPSTPEMETKVMLGRHIWDYAQMADALGKRTFELRQPAHYTLPASDEYEMLLREVARLRTTEDRLAGLYEGILPGLIERYRRYMADTDPILDEPTVVIVERIVAELERQREHAAALRRELGLGLAAAASLAARDREIRMLAREPVGA
jgi:hypothetical protein